MTNRGKKIGRGWGWWNLNEDPKTFCTVVCGLWTSSAFADLHNGMEADRVLGQPDFVSNGANLTQSGFVYSYTAATDGKRLIIEDYNVNRILIWNTIPVENNAPADVVLGQPDFTTSNDDVSQRGMAGPWGTFTNGGNLAVSDCDNNRILIWNSIPTSSYAPADIVLGQPDFTSSNWGISQRDLNCPGPSVVTKTHLIVLDAGNHRILIWNNIPNTHYAPADVVVGQSDFNSNSNGLGPSKINNPYANFYDGMRLFVADRDNNRILIWNSLPQKNGVPADVVVGQPDFFSNQCRTGQQGICIPEGVFSDGQSLYVADSNNNRVLIWKKIPTTNGVPADFVLGQPDFETTSAGTSRSKMSFPESILRIGSQLFVSDAANNRWLIFNLGSSSSQTLGPQFTQGKGVLGKVFEDLNGNGIQDSPPSTVDSPQRGTLSTVDSGPSTERGLEGIKVVSDTGIYAITDEDGKYHFPYIETGQHLLKIDESTLPEGSILTTDSPYKVTVTDGILTKVSFGIHHPEAPKDISLDSSLVALTQNDGSNIKVSISQDPAHLKPRLDVTATLVHSPPSTDHSSGPSTVDNGHILFTIQCNYFLFIDHSEIQLFNKDNYPFKTILLPNPIPYEFKLPITDLPKDTDILYYQLKVYDKEGNEDRTGVKSI